MQISYHWIKDFLKTDLPIDKISDILTNLGLEVENIDTYESVKGGLKGVVTGHVISCEKHPNADRLNLTKVDIGTNEPLPIVCGAPNVAKGQKVAVATVGTILYDNKGEAFEIKKGKIRGELSLGMICAEDELGLGDSHDGIMVLDEQTPTGKPCAEIFDLYTDQIFNIGLTPNRTDAMSHYGVARDLQAGILQQENTNIELLPVLVSEIESYSAETNTKIEVQEYDVVPRYCGISMNVIIGESPKWIQDRLRAINITPKNNVIDITNYVLHELGQPLHAFDKDKIKGNKVIVRKAKKGEKIITLDNNCRELDPEDIVICDQDSPICIAGIFGGINSRVSDKTTSIFLESAYFDAVSIRKTAKRHGLNTDASFRYERGADFNITLQALQRAVNLLEKYAQATSMSRTEDLYPAKLENKQIKVSISNIKKVIGTKINEETIISILKSLEIKIISREQHNIMVQIPSYRVDVTREIDVIEEILRIYGYNNIPNDNNLYMSLNNTKADRRYPTENRIAEQLTAQGFFEIMNNSLTTPNYTEDSITLNPKQNVTIINPLSRDLSIMRRSMAYSALETVAYNINRQRDSLKLFEYGKIYHKTNDGYKEQNRLAISISGNLYDKEVWNTTDNKMDLYYLKQVVSNILKKLSIRGTSFSKELKNDIFDQGLSISYKDKILVEMGIIRKQILKKISIKKEVFFADFDWDTILSLISKTKKEHITPISKYPEISRDFALLLDSDIQFEQLVNIAHKTEKKILKDVVLFDVYEGKKLPEGKKSYGVRFVFQDTNKTLTDKQVDKIMSKFKQYFEQQLNAQLR